MRVIQLLSTIANGDAVSNDAVALEKVIKSMGYSTGIYAESIVSNVKRGVAQPVEKIGTLDKSDVLIYHFSTGTKLNYEVLSKAVYRVRASTAPTASAAFDECADWADEIQEDYNKRHGQRKGKC